MTQPCDHDGRRLGAGGAAVGSRAPGAGRLLLCVTATATAAASTARRSSADHRRQRPRGLRCRPNCTTSGWPPLYQPRCAGPRAWGRFPRLIAHHPPRCRRWRHLVKHGILMNVAVAAVLPSDPGPRAGPGEPILTAFCHSNCHPISLGYVYRDAVTIGALCPGQPGLDRRRLTCLRHTISLLLWRAVAAR